MHNPGSPLDAISHAIASAVHKDLPSVETRIPELKNPLTGKIIRVASTEMQRPRIDDASVIIFPQMWDSTALGYGGMGGAAMTTAYTVIVSNHRHNPHLVYCVYFGNYGQLAYSVSVDDLSSKGFDVWKEDLSKRQLKSKAEAEKYYV